MASPASSPANRLIAYRVHDIAAGSFPEIKSAPPDRWWMDVSMGGWPNRCLPLRIANQLGWFILNNEKFEAEWSGGRDLNAVTFLPPTGKPFYAQSMFGGGIITFVLPYLFRTPPGWQMLVRGPVNHLKDGIGPLEGVVETDWSTSTFTMNWRFTRERKRVKFEKDEPIAMIVPMRLGELEDIQPEVRNIESDPATLEEFRAWHRSRVQKVEQNKQRDGERASIEGHYVRGETATGHKAGEHRAQLRLKPFADLEPGHPVPLPQNGGVQRSWLARLMGR